MSNTESRFEYAAVLKPEALNGVENGGDDGRRSVMGVQCRCASKPIFIRREQLSKALPFRIPFAQSVAGEHLRNAAPPNISDEGALLVVSGFLAFRVESVDKLDGREVVPAFLFQRTVAKRILWPNAIIVRV
jgi:hypothetical protein